MSTILEFYIEKEKRELINTISSAKYINEKQKETMITVMLEDVDDLKDDLRDLQNKLRDKKSYQTSHIAWKVDEYEALEKRIDKKKAYIKDKESRTTHGAGHKSPGQTTYRGG